MNRNRILVVNHGPGEQVAQVFQASPTRELSLPVRSELLPPHTQQEILYSRDQYVVVKEA